MVLQFTSSKKLGDADLEIALDAKGLEALQTAIEVAVKEGHDHLFTNQWNGRGELTNHAANEGYAFKIVTIRFHPDEAEGA